ncbi:MAG: hypothetical protein ABSF62_12810 [Bryobacteraceae bacterium]
MKISRWILLAGLLCALAGAAPVKPDFSGTWKLNNDKSTKDATPDRVYICEIHQKGDTITVSTKATPAPAVAPVDGTFIANNKLVVDKAFPHYHYTQTNWEGATLIIQVVDKESRKETAKVLGVIRESWALSADGKTLTKFRQNAANGKTVDQKYTFDKQ